MQIFNKVAIVGTGLIGGSIALDIKKMRLAREVVGVSRHAQSIERAVKMRAIDRGGREFGIIKGADLVILAAPVEAIIKMAPEIARLIGPDCLLTDVASTKKRVVSALGARFANYVGSHPLAGSEKRGIDNARSGIFKNSLCILTPAGSTSASALKKIRSFWERLGSRVVLMDPGLHDKTLAFTSHLPHVTAFSLMNSVPAQTFQFAATGLKDTSRLASCDPELWADIFLTNSDNVAAAVAGLCRQLSAMAVAIKKRRRRALLKLLTVAQKKRELLL